MANIPVKPPRPVIDWKNPLTIGLVFDSSLSEGSGLITWDTVQKTKGSLDNGVSWIKSKYGNCLSFDGIDDAVTYNSSGKQSGVLSVSVEALVYPTGNGESNEGCIIRKGTQVDQYFDIRRDNGQNTFAWRTDYSNNPGWGAPNGLWSANEWIHIVVVHKNINSTASKPIFYIRGKKYTTYSFEVVPTGSMGSDNSNITIGNIGTIRTWQGYISYVRYWNRALTDSEALLMFSDPWRIYKKSNLDFLSNSIVVQQAIRYYRQMMGIGM